MREAEPWVAPPQRRWPGFRRWLLATGVAATFVCAVGGGALLHVGIAPARHLTARLLTKLLGPVFVGTVQIDAIDHVDLAGVAGGTVTVYAPGGARVLTATGVRARSPILPLLWKVLRGGPIDLAFGQARVEHVDLLLDSDAEGVPLVARAFTPRPSPTSTATGPGPRVSVWLPQVQLATARLHGTLLGLRDLDVDLSGVAGSVLAGTERTSIRLNRYAVAATGLGLSRTQGTARTLIEVPSSTGQPLSVWATFDGDMGELPIAARGGLDGDELTLRADSPRATPEAVLALLPWWPLRVPVDLHAEAKGTLPNLAVRGHARVGEGEVDVTGALVLTGGARAALDVQGSRIALTAFDARAPAGEVSATGNVKLAILPDQPLYAAIEAQTEPTELSAIGLPAAAITATLDHGALAGSAHLQDATLSGDVKFGVHTDPGEPVTINLDVTARAAAMQRVAWLSSLGSGGLVLRARGELVRGRVSGTFDAQLANYARSGVQFAAGSAQGALHGPPDALVVNGQARAKGLSVGPLYFPDAQATIEGPINRLAVTATLEGEDAPRVVARGTVSPTPSGAKLTSVQVTAERKDVKLTAEAQAIVVDASGIELQSVVVQGGGEPARGSLRMTDRRITAQLAAPDLDMGRVARLFVPNVKVSGRLTVDVQAELGAAVERAHVRVGVREGEFLGWSGISATAEAAVDQRRLSGGADVRVADLGSVTVTTSDALLGGSLLQARSYTRASGQVQVESALDLAEWTRRMPPMLTHWPVLAGVLRARALVARENVEHSSAHAGAATEALPPNIDVLAWSDGLSVGQLGASAGPLAAAGKPWLQGVDGQASLHVEGDRKHAALTLRAIDRVGVFASLTALADLPLTELWADRKNLAERLANVPLRAELRLPRRSLAAFPEPLRIADLNGVVEGSCTLTGTVHKPQVAASLRGSDVTPAGASSPLPMSVEADAVYDGAVGGVRVRASRPEGVVVDAVSRIDAPLASMLDPDIRTPWRASGSARFFSFPLGSIPQLADREVSGRASGTVSVSDLNVAPEVHADLDVEGVQVSRAVFPRGTLFLRVADNAALASAELQQGASRLSASASGRVKWPTPYLPQIDDEHPTDFYLAARDLRAAVLYPVLFRGIFNYFDGDLNGTLHLHQGRVDGKLEQTVDGAFDLRDGAFQIPEVGQEFRQARAHIVVGENGAVQVTDVSANAVTGRVSASGNLKLRGFAFVSGEGEVRIARGQAVPLTFEGVPLGEAWGTLLLHAKMAGEHQVKIDFDVPVFHTDLPESSARGVQSLADHPDFVVGRRLPSGDLVPILLGAPQQKRAEDALDWHLTFYLGQDVRVRQGSSMELQFGGQPRVDLTDEARVSGAIDLLGGRLEVFGKRFELEHGSAKFEGEEPSNPYVTATARWDAPDSSRIYADFVGPLRTGVLTLRSEPARTQSEIVSVLLFGALDAGSASAGLQTQKNNGTTTAGAVIAGGAVTTSVNQVLSSVSPLDITTRVTNENQTWTPEVAVQLSPRVSAEVSYRPTLPKPGENPDRVLLTVDWRFRRNWSIATTVGQNSSIMDLIWQYRY